MTDYSISLPKANTVRKPNVRENTWINQDMKLALSAFDVDGKEGLGSDELLQAFDYFVNKEKEIAVSGKKGDGIITSKDIEQIIKTDSKFSAIRNKLNDDNKVTDLLSNIVITLSALVQNKINGTVDAMSAQAIRYRDEKYRHYQVISSNVATNTQTETIEVDGKKVQICRNNEGQRYVKSADGKYIYTNPAYVAKCLGYETESTWFGLGAHKYYTTVYERTFVPVGNGGHHASDEFKQYKVWNEDTHSFTDGKCKSTGNRIHYMGTR